jgi:two-component system, NtrC family, sensor kinase
VRLRVTSAKGDTDAREVIVLASGIPAEIANRVFDPFFTTKEIGRGTGQGLAIARTIVVDRHRGSMTFETDPGQGTTFHVRLPIKAAVDQPAHATA